MNPASPTSLQSNIDKKKRKQTPLHHTEHHGSIWGTPTAGTRWTLVNLDFIENNKVHFPEQNIAPEKIKHGG